MRTAAGVTVFVLVVLAHAGWGSARRRGGGGARPHVQFECLDSADCGVDRCCTIKPERYSYPSCNGHGQRGDICRPTAQLFNASLTYPDGLIANVTNVHYILCACAHGLECHQGTCVDSNSAQDLNSVEE